MSAYAIQLVAFGAPLARETDAMLAALSKAAAVASDEPSTTPEMFGDALDQLREAATSLRSPPSVPSFGVRSVSQRS